MNDACPKCGAVNGDDWSQCDGACPMPGSPHYDDSVVPLALPLAVLSIMSSKHQHTRADRLRSAMNAAIDDLADLLTHMHYTGDARYVSTINGIVVPMYEALELDGSDLEASIDEIRRTVDGFGLPSSVEVRNE